jgi:hypothetical protein
MTAKEMLYVVRFGASSGISGGDCNNAVARLSAGYGRYPIN